MTNGRLVHHQFDRGTSDLMCEQSLLSCLCWNPGPGHNRPNTLDSLVAGPLHAVALENPERGDCATGGVWFEVGSVSGGEADGTRQLQARRHVCVQGARVTARGLRQHDCRAEVASEFAGE